MFSASYKIFQEIGLIYYKIEGPAELSKMIALYDEISNDPEFNIEYKGIGDWREAKNNLSRSEVIELAEYVKEQKLSKGHWVALVNSPVVTALSQVYANLVAPQHPLDACSTVERASEILKLNLPPDIEETDTRARRFTA